MGANNFDVIQKGTGIQIGRRGMQAKTYRRITIDEALDFKERFDYPALVSISMSGGESATVKYQSKKTNPTIQVTGGDENYLTIAGIDLSAGRNFSPTEVQAGRAVALIGESIATKLFSKPQKAIDQIVTIDNRRFLVIGVLGAKGSSGIFSPENMVIVPLVTARAFYANPQTTFKLTVQVDNAYEMDLALYEATGLMRNIRRLRSNEPEDFDTSKSDKLSSILIEQSVYVTTAATIIGIITLLGGAIGLMNIMLVSVSERIREIGVCKALGANRRTILTQFLVESMVICQLGGLMGIVLGTLAGNAVSVLVNGPFIMPWAWLAGGIAICLAVGLVAGIYPALRAANVDPIESLRHE